MPQSEPDRSTGSQKAVPPSSLALRSLLTDLNLVDLWRIRNDKVKAYSFHSGRHGSSSRIDNMFFSPPLINNIAQIEMLPILISDHSPMSCTLTPLADYSKARRWRFNDTLLSNATFLSQMKMQLREFIELNAV